MDALLRAFVEAAGCGVGPELDAIALALRRLVASARATRPKVEVDDALLGRYLGARVERRPPLVESIARLRGSELLLACACAQGDETAIESFEREFLAPAAAALLRSGSAQVDIDDAMQLLREKLFVAGAKITEFSGRGSLSSWTRVALAHQHVSVLRSKGRTVPLDDDEPCSLGAVDPDLAMVRRRYGDVFRAAFQDAFGRLTPEQRNVLRLHFVDGLNLDRIAPILQVSRATVGRRVLESKRSLLENILALLGQRLKATPSEIESLIAVVRSTLHGSLSALLRE